MKRTVAVPQEHGNTGHSARAGTRGQQYLTWSVVSGVVLCLGLIWGAEMLFASAQVFKLKFKKQIPLEKHENVFTYTIKKGDYVYSILRRFDVPETELEETLKQVEKLNPHLEDIGKVRPGDSLHLPEPISPEAGKKGEACPAEAAAAISGLKRVPYTVKPGDTVFTVLKQHTDLPDALIKIRYLEAFRRLNPDIEDIDRILPGQKVWIPLPAATRTASGTEAEKAPPSGTLEPGRRGPPAGPPLSPDLSEKTIVRSLLRTFGFRFVTGSDLLLPSGDENWVRINLERMEVARTEWGESILFLPGPLHTQEDLEAFAAAGLKTCRVPPSWDRVQVFQALEELLRPRFITWPAQEQLVLSFGEIVLELRSHNLVGIRRQGKVRLYLFQDKADGQTRPSGLLTGFLHGRDITFLVPTRTERENLSWTAPPFPKRETLLVPRLPETGFLAALKSYIPVENLVPPGLGRDFSEVYAGLRSLGRAARTVLPVRLFDSGTSRIGLRVPLIRLEPASGEVFLLEEKHRDAYLVSLLNLKGYTTYLLED